MTPEQKSRIAIAAGIVEGKMQHVVGSLDDRIPENLRRQIVLHMDGAEAAMKDIWTEIEHDDK